MTGAEIFYGAAAAGTALSVIQGLSAASSQADAKRQDAAFKQQQADEILAREAINRTAIENQVKHDQSLYAASFASAGWADGGIGGQIEIFNRAQEVISNSRREAQFKTDMLRKGAQMDFNLASDIVTSSYYTGAGSILTTGAKIAYMKAGSDK